jgi:hypothetical protein
MLIAFLINKTSLREDRDRIIFQCLLTSNEIDLTDKCRYSTSNSILCHTFSKAFRFQMIKHQVDRTGEVSFGTATW